MKPRDLGIVIVYITLHLVSSGQQNYVLFLNQTSDFFDIPIALAVGTTYKVILAVLFLKIQKIEFIYILPIIGLALITRIVFHGPFPIAIIAGWFYLYSRKE
jgi:hypothetical protein